MGRSPTFLDIGESESRDFISKLLLQRGYARSKVRLTPRGAFQIRKYDRGITIMSRPSKYLILSTDSSHSQPANKTWRPFLAGRAGYVFAAMLALATAGRAVAEAALAEKVEAEAAPGPGLFPGEVPFGFGDDELIIPEIFTSHLPFTLPKYAFRLRVNPHLGDLRNKNRLRVSTGVRYGLTENWEVGVGSDLYFSHGYGEIPSFDSRGAANLQLSTKVNLGQPWFAGWYVGTGFEYAFPTGHPPAELTDGLRHFSPFITFSHRLETHRNMRIFWGLRFDEVQHTSLPGEFGRNAFQESSSGITGGWVVDRKNMHYTFEASLDTTRIFGRTEKEVFSLRPGVMWEIPSRRGPQVKGHWVVGGAVNSTTGPGGTSLGASFRLSYTRDIKPRVHQPAITPTP